MLNRLASLLGRKQARLELKWLSDFAHSHQLSLEKLVDRRMQDEPLQYILGTQPFGPLSLLVRPPVLIPRPETEHWAIRLSELCRPTASMPISLLDIGTGSGCIPLLLCHLWPQGSLKAQGVDISDDAIKLAEENAKHLGFSLGSPLSNVFTTLKTCVLARSFARHPSLSPPYDVITSNPPYITFNEFLDLPPSVMQYEDAKALFGGPGRALVFYEAIMLALKQGGLLRRKTGTLALEVGTQAEEVAEMMHNSGIFRDVDIWKDLWGKDRTVVGVAS